MLAIVDRQIGQIIELLKRLEIENDTIIFVCGDNGGQDYFHEERRFERGFFGPNVNPRTGVQFRGEKRTLFEGGLRIPMMVRWPGQIAAGAVSEHLGYFPDVMPTLADIAGIDTPPMTDGISVLPTLTGEARQAQHEYLYWEFLNQTAVRLGDWKGYKRGDAPWALYDLGRDISEAHDVAGEHPDLIRRIRSITEAAHTPPEVGQVFDRTLIEKDRREGQKTLVSS
jgi:arylsulfatase A-like enzyme